MELVEVVVSGVLKSEVAHQSKRGSSFSKFPTRIKQLSRINTGGKFSDI